MLPLRLLIVSVSLLVAVVGAPTLSVAQVAQQEQISVKEAFEAARALGTPEAWTAFLTRFPEGFYADLARAYMKKLGDTSSAATTPAATPQPSPSIPATTPAQPAPQAGRVQVAAVPSPNDRSVPPTEPAKPAMPRGGRFMGFDEKFNRYYTDPTWKPAKTIYVGPQGAGDGTARDKPMAVVSALQAAQPGTLIHFLPGAYQGGVDFQPNRSGTYDQPIVLYAERGSGAAVTMTCAVGSRQACINVAGASYIAVDGFEFVGGRYGVRAVSAGLAASQHSRGIAILNSTGRDQDRDPFFSSAADWAVWERNIAFGAKKGDGHGMYLSNGGDWNIVRFNISYNNASTGLQINADPASTCTEVGIKVDDAKCDAYAGEGEGGQGASDYFLLDGNHFHNCDVGTNFTSVRRSIIRNNIFGPHVRHNVSFWQETDNPKLGSSENRIVHNLFITRNNRHAIQFANMSIRNEFANNIVLGISITAGAVAANPASLLVSVDASAADNAFRNNVYVGGKIEGRFPAETETVLEAFDAGWFKAFPKDHKHTANDLSLAAGAPFLGKGAASADAPTDRNGRPRSTRVDPGPINGP